MVAEAAPVVLLLVQVLVSRGLRDLGDVVVEGMMEVAEVVVSGVVVSEAATEVGSEEVEEGEFIIPWMAYLVHR